MEIARFRALRGGFRRNPLPEWSKAIFHRQTSAAGSAILRPATGNRVQSRHRRFGEGAGASHIVGLTTITRPRLQICYRAAVVVPTSAKENASDTFGYSCPSTSTYG